LRGGKYSGANHRQQHSHNHDRRVIIPGMNLQTLQTLLIDGDGVLWHADRPMPSLNRFFDTLTQRGIDWALLTNNASNTLDAYVDKLARFGVHATRQQVFSSASVTATYLTKHFERPAAVYVVGSPGLKHTLSEAGFSVFDGAELPDAPVVAVVGSIDFDLSYDKLKVATLLIRSGLPFIGTNPDRTFPTPSGLIPGTGSVLAALSAASGTQPLITGKPRQPIFDEAISRLNADRRTTAMLGDRLETDILGGKEAGIGTILVLSGVTSEEDAASSEIQPDLVFPSIDELADELIRVAASDR
jgi:4-nitrophenyl phosphatase